MQAARLVEGSQLRLEQVELPRLRPLGAIVSVLASMLPTYTDDVVKAASFHHTFMPERPFTPGVSCVGRVDEVADDVFDVKPGQLVLVDPLVSSSGIDRAAAANVTRLQGAGLKSVAENGIASVGLASTHLQPPS